MKKLKAFGLIILSIVAFAGCAIRNPNYDASKPPTDYPGSNPLYIPPTNSIANVGATLHAVNNATAPIDPYSPLADRGIEFGLGLATIIAGFIANTKNKQANTATAAAQHLATVLPDNMVTQAINSAPTPAIASAVAAHLSAAPETGVVAINTKPAA